MTYDRVTQTGRLAGENGTRARETLAARDAQDAVDPVVAALDRSSRPICAEELAYARAWWADRARTPLL